MVNQFSLILLCYLLFFPTLALSQSKINSEPVVLPSVHKPKAVLSQANFNFGSVQEGEKVTHTYILKNKGRSSLEIKEIQPSCGCTVASMDWKILEPGTSGEIKVVFDTTGFWGNKVKTTIIRTNDPENSSLLLTLQGIVRRDVSITPPRVYFGSINKGTAVKEVLTLTIEDPEAIKITEIKSHSPKLDISWNKFRNSGQFGYKIEVKLPENLPSGVFQDRIIIHTTSTRNPRIVVPLYARVEDDIITNPRDIYFGLVRTPLKKPLKKNLRVVNKGKESIKLLDVSSSDPLINLKWEEVVPGKEFVVHIEIPEYKSGRLESQILIKTNHPDEKKRVLKVSVYGIFSKMLLN